jgi:hypothetical protein
MIQQSRSLPSRREPGNTSPGLVKVSIDLAPVLRAHMQRNYTSVSMISDVEEMEDLQDADAIFPGHSARYFITSLRFLMRRSAFIEQSLRILCLLSPGDAFANIR